MIDLMLIGLWLNQRFMDWNIHIFAYIHISMLCGVKRQPGKFVRIIAVVTD